MLDGLISILNDYQYFLVWLGIVSTLCFVLSLIAIPIVIKRLPVDYFVKSPFSHCHSPPSLQRLFLNTCKNIAGLVLILAGLIMLITPGQGLLTIIVGVLICDFPGKLVFEKWLITQPIVKQSLNWIRRKQKLADFIID